MVAGTGRSVLLVVCGGIAAYKALELARRLREHGIRVRPVLTAAGARFVTPMALQALCGERVSSDLFSLTEESEMGHIALSRSSDLIVVCPATADMLARMATGLADDLATTLLLATDTPVLVAPAMNVRMWQHPATQTNIATLRARGVTFVGPESGLMACNESGPGRLAEPDVILAAIMRQLAGGAPLAGYTALVTAGPTHEPVDPVRYLANRSSGTQGYAIATALAQAGAEVTLVSGPTTLPDPSGVTTIRVESAREMLTACQQALPCDIAVCAAAVADWHVAPSAQKIKKAAHAPPPVLHLVPNPDILATLSQPSSLRPRLVIGFAAETEHLISHATAKRLRKGCDWMVANDVSPATGIMGGTENEVIVIDETGCAHWPRLDKMQVAHKLVARIAAFLHTSHLHPDPQDSDGRQP